MSPLPLMPKATAVWLIDKTNLTFEQIADFCGLHKLEVQAIADGEVAAGIVGLDPILNRQLTSAEIKRCEDDPRARLKMQKSDLPQPVSRTKGPRYTPVSKRADKPDAIAFLVKNYPELLDAQIARLLGTTKDTIAKVRDRSHWNAANIKPHDPIVLGLCKKADLDAAVAKAQRRVARERKAAGLDDAQDERSQPETGDSSLGAFAPATQDPGAQDQPDIDPDAMFKGMG